MKQSHFVVFQARKNPRST